MYTLDKVLKDSVAAHASDIHFTVGCSPFFRIDGMLIPQEGEKLMPKDMEELLLPILDQRHRKELEENGQTDLAYAIRGVGRFRVSIFKQRGTLASVMRCLPFTIPEAKSLGIPEEVQALTQKRRGLALVTGPTGSGKSTTLASLVDIINRTYPYHIITLEDPIEYLHRHQKSIVNQREIGSDSNDYTQALRAALREDPDVILVGEMRDLETISTALTAAETGHLVLSTLHTIGAANTIDRIIDVFPANQQHQIAVQLSLVLTAVISQQLVPGVDGRMLPAFEIMTVTPAIRNMIRDSKIPQIEGVINSSAKEDMISMDASLLSLFKKGQITKETALTYATNPEMLGRKLI